jgi:NitT/TauT family transport system ATP-binding protein
MHGSDDRFVRIEKLGKRFGDGRKLVEAFEDLNLDVHKGEFLCLVGPSGCGKTTLLRTLAGVEKASTGNFSVDWGDKNKTTPLSMVFQQPGLYPWMSVEGNLRFVLNASPIETERHDEIISSFIERVGLTKFRSFHPHQLSGGMKQRVSLIRAFCVYPQLLLMDEPFVFLDYQNRMILHQLLLELWEDQRQTIIFVTHNINEAVTLGDRVMVMTASPGRFKREVVCDFPRPRDVVELRKNSEFGQTVVEITEDLKEEIERAQAMEIAERGDPDNTDNQTPLVRGLEV